MFSQTATSKDPLWLLPNLLSLDAPIVALVWQGFLASAFHVELSVGARAGLAFAVWAVYLADRILDTNQPAEFREAARHRFHRSNRSALTVLFYCTVMAGASIGASLAGLPLFRLAVPVLLLVVLYLTAVHFASPRMASFLPKEFIAAGLFTIGPLLVPWLGSAHHAELVISGVGLLFLFLLNMVAIEEFEWRTLRRGTEPAPHRWTMWFAKHYLGCAVMVIGSSLAVPMFHTSSGLRQTCLSIALAALALVVIHRRRDYLSPDAHRVLVDLVLLSPIPVWVIHSL